MDGNNKSTEEKQSKGVVRGPRKIEQKDSTLSKKENVMIQIPSLVAKLRRSDKKKIQRKEASDRMLKKHYTPPRSMTEEEKVYYAEHKSLNGFHSSNSTPPL